MTGDDNKERLDLNGGGGSEETAAEEKKSDDLTKVGDANGSDHCERDDKDGDDVDDDQEQQALTKDDDDRVEEEEEEDPYGVQNEAIPATIYSLMFVSPTWSRAYCYALVLWAVQITMTVAALLNAVDTSGSSNPAQIPAGVPVTVTVTQALIIPVAVASQVNFIEGIIRVNDRVNEHIEFDPMSHSFINWFFSSFAQMLVGLGLLMLVFLFTMQSETVFQVLVNIVALFAVANISTNGFFMANRGFLGYKVWKETVNVINHKIDRSYKSNTIHQVGYVLCVFGMFVAYGVIVSLQRSGYYRCASIYTQFDDDFDIDLPFLSGVYDRVDQQILGRFFYADDVTHSTLYMAYCNNEDSWGIAPYDDRVDQCSYGVLSSVTDSFDASKTDELPWRVRGLDESFVHLSQSIIQCADCDQSSCLPRRGTCTDNKCVCKDGRYGIHCEFRAPCEEIVVNANNENFPPIQSLGSGEYALIPRRFLLLKDDNGTIAEAYNRPVYYSSQFRFVMLFTGRRWAIIRPTFEILEGDDFGFEVARDYLLDVFSSVHMYSYLKQQNIQRYTVSETVDTNSPLDQGLPIGLNWIGTRLVRSSSAPTVALAPNIVYDPVFICAQCDDIVNKCENLGVCDNSTGVGVCKCVESALLEIPLHTGALCEKQVTCKEARDDFPDVLPTGCLADYVCQEDGTCSCTNEMPDAGRFCQLLPCNHPYNLERFPPLGCANDGRCSAVTGRCICTDDALFEGKYCQTETPNCFDEVAIESHPDDGCNGRGVCNVDTGFCACNSTSYDGRFCQIESAPCYLEEIQDRYPGGCDNNSTCNLTTGSCDCSLPVFGGNYCERARFECFHPFVLEIWPPGCSNGGLCNSTGSCTCPTDWSGRYCQRIVANRTVD